MAEKTCDNCAHDKERGDMGPHCITCLRHRNEANPRAGWEPKQGTDWVPLPFSDDQVEFLRIVAKQFDHGTDHFFNRAVEEYKETKKVD